MSRQAHVHEIGVVRNYRLPDHVVWHDELAIVDRQEGRIHQAHSMNFALRAGDIHEITNVKGPLEENHHARDEVGQ